MSSSSAQSKMRTNGMFIRSFDSKRYQELQQQKQQILQKQKQLTKIKERKQKKDEKGGDEVGTLATVNETSEYTGQGDENEIIMRLAQEEPEETATSNADKENGNIVADNLAVANDSVQNGSGDSQLKLVHSVPDILIQNVNGNASKDTLVSNAKSDSDLEKVYANSKSVSDKASMVNLSSGTLEKVPRAAQAAQEYAIIAKQNKQAIIRDTEMVGKEISRQQDKPDIIVTNANTNQGNSTKVLQTKTKAYAVIDITKTKAALSKIAKETNQVSDSAGNGKKNKMRNKSGDSSDNGKGKQGKIINGHGGTDHGDTTVERGYMYSPKRMSRSAGYSGDIDTSTSSLEPDMDFMSMELYGKPKFLITDEQLSSLHTVGSSSSG